MAVKDTRFGIIRHAKTLWNIQKKIQGHTDVALSPQGIEQAKNWAEQIEEAGPFNKIFASDLKRCLQTVEIINTSMRLSVHTDKRLRELDWGQWVGKTGDELQNEIPDALASRLRAGWEFRPPAGETRRELLERAEKALLEAHARWEGQNILVVTHGGVIKCLTYSLLGRRFHPDEPPVIAPYNIHMLSVSKNRLKLEKLNALGLGVI